MAVRLHKRFRRAFFVDARRLAHLDAILAEWGEPRHFQVTFTNGLVIPYETINDVIGIPNTGERSISDIYARVEIFELRMTVTVASNAPSDQLEFEVRAADDKSVMILANALEEWVREITPWYSIISTARSPFPALALLLLVGVPPYVYLLVRLLSSATLSAAILAVFLAIAFFGLMFVADRIVNFFFPASTFAVGYGADRAERRTFWRRVVGTGILLSVLVRAAYDQFR